ncbi:MAG: DNA-directed RNA polymerase subunit beta [Deltaproteobacteria bacterium]|jgi:DNA-directed RNA polymerase subunit beta|nr:DNA-directed RNA polymerase subunit beta [Deltaproteobacteria bacterium]
MPDVRDDALAFLSEMPDIEFDKFIEAIKNQRIIINKQLQPKLQPKVQPELKPKVQPEIQKRADLILSLPGLGRFRKNFGKTKQIFNIPNLLDIQLNSYNRFLQKDTAPEARKNSGLQAVFNSVFPIQDKTGLINLKFVSYTVGDIKSDPDECLATGLTYEVPLKITVDIEVYGLDEETGAKFIKDIIQKEFFFGNLPLMTDKGSFIINGSKRVIVSLLHRSPGIYFYRTRTNCYSSVRFSYLARIIPLRGSILVLEIDINGIIKARIGLRRKFPVTILLRALGYSTEELFDYLYEPEVLILKDDGLVALNQTSANVDVFYGRYVACNIFNPKTGDVICGLNQDFNQTVYEKLKNHGIKEVPLLPIDKNNITSTLRKALHKEALTTVDDAILQLYFYNRNTTHPNLKAARLYFDKLFFNPEHYELSANGRRQLNHRLFYNEPEQAADHTVNILRPVDILAAVRELIRFMDSGRSADDINHLAHRRVMTVGEQLEDQYRVGLLSMKKSIQVRNHSQIIENMSQVDIINPRYFSSVIKTFFEKNPFSQIIDQNNPLSEITFKRLLSDIWWPYSFTKKWPDYVVFNLHQSHYGRICPIDTIEKASIAQIVSFPIYARVNEFGFIETPYRQMNEGRTTSQVVYLTALTETDLTIAQANVDLAIAQANVFLDEDEKITQPQIPCRINGKFVLKKTDEIVLADVSPNQTFSVAASLIPFLEHDDTKRAILGANLQRQAIPLLRAEAPLIGTGLEEVVARDSDMTVLAKYDGVVEKADATRIVIRYNNIGTLNDQYLFGNYKLIKFLPTNQGTCNNQRPVVKPGEEVKKGQIIAAGPATEMGELALGRNVLVAFMPWGGYNFEDSILVSERLVKDDLFTSIHLEVYDISVGDAEIGPEEAVREHWRWDHNQLNNLSDSGIIRVGTKVKSGELLVGRLSPCGEIEPSPTDMLLRALFGEKPSSFKDTSLKVPHGVEGTVIDVQVDYDFVINQDFNWKFFPPSQKDMANQLREDIQRLKNFEKDDIRRSTRETQDLLSKLLVGKSLSLGANIRKYRWSRFFSNLTDKITSEMVYSLSPLTWRKVSLAEDNNGAVSEAIERLLIDYRRKISFFRQSCQRKIEDCQSDYNKAFIKKIKSVKVYLAMKRKISVGDKMADRHGNKGVVSRFLPEEDMPFLNDGTPVDLVINPINAPYRLNVGQFFETHLGWASWALGQQIGDLVDNTNCLDLRIKLRKLLGKADFDKSCKDLSDDELLEKAKGSRHGLHMTTPVFDGADESDIRNILKYARLPESGQTILRDGRTGEQFDNEVTVGVMYMFKVSPTVDDICQARSIGPMSLLAQQPLANKPQPVGQKVDERAFLALKAYGAAYNLQEFVTVKSDDLLGKNRMYSDIIKGDNTLRASLPTNFKLFVKHLQALGLVVELSKTTGENKSEIVYPNINEEQLNIHKTTDLETTDIETEDIEADDIETNYWMSLLNQPPIVSLPKVLSAIQELKAEQKAISARSVRKKLSVGNLIEIYTLVKQILDEEAASAKSSVQVGDQYKELTSTIIACTQKLIVEKTSEIESEKSMLANEVDECKTTMTGYEQQINELKKDEAEKTDTINSLEASNQALDDQLEALKVIYDEQLNELRKTFQEQLMDKNVALSKLQTETEQLRDNLSEAISTASNDASYYKGLHEGTTNKITPSGQKTPLK